MSNEMKTQGTELYVLDDTIAAPAALKIGNITNIGELGGTTDDIEVTNLDDVAKQFIQGLPDNGELSLELRHSAACERQTLEPPMRVAHDYAAPVVGVGAALDQAQARHGQDVGSRRVARQGGRERGLGAGAVLGTGQ